MIRPAYPSQSSNDLLLRAMLLATVTLLSATLFSLRAAVATDTSIVEVPAWLKQDDFVRAVAQLALIEKQRSNIPASITAAQAILESDWGRAPLARSGNNYFGIKCKTYWKGRTIMHPDDDYDAAGNRIPSCFRAYANVEESFRDHSDFLRNSERYAVLFSYEVSDYKAWAHGLRACGYATDRNYAHKLIALIERLELYALDWPDDSQTAWLMALTEDATPITQQKTFMIPAEYKPSGDGEAPTERNRPEGAKAILSGAQMRR